MTTDTLARARAQAGITIEPVIWFSGHVSYQVHQDGRKVATRRTVEEALALADELALDLWAARLAAAGITIIPWVLEDTATGQVEKWALILQDGEIVAHRESMRSAQQFAHDLWLGLIAAGAIGEAV